jgi:uncharacterized protein (TIGR03435 family)
MRFRTTLALMACLATFGATALAQQPAAAPAGAPSFEAATIKPPDPKAKYQKAGFYDEPGGRIFFGGTVKMLVETAFDVHDFQVAGGADWTDSRWFEINAVPPDNSLSRLIKVPNAEPTAEQQQMLQSLLRERFGFKSHFETKEGQVYLLTRGSKALQLKPPKDATEDPRAIVMMKQGGIDDGQAEGTNATMDYLAVRLTRYLRLSVVNKTEIAGSYDFDLPADDPERTDIVGAVYSVVDRLGLKLKRDKGQVQTLVIDHVEMPSEN